MAKHKRKSDSKNVAEEPDARPKARRGKGLKIGVATLTIGAASLGACYSPYFQAATSDWRELCRAFIAKFSSNDVLSDSEGNVATEDEKMRDILAQAPSFRDFLTDEYGEEEARELLGIDATSSSASTFSETGNVDFTVPTSGGWKNVEALDGAFGDETSFSEPKPTASFADYVAAESAAEPLETQEMENDVAALLDSQIPESETRFADYVAAESDASEDVETQDVADEADAALGDDDFETDAVSVNDEKTRFTSPVDSDALDEDETALAARLEDEMKSRGVGNPRIERWGERFWRASGFATTENGVAAFCEAVDVDPTAAQRAALAKFEAASF